MISNSDYCAFQLHADSKFKAQPSNASFATMNQMFNDSSQIPTTAERVVIKSLSTDTEKGTVLGSSRKQGGAAEIFIEDSEKRILRLSF